MKDGDTSTNTQSARDPGETLEHGGRLGAARRRFSNAPEPLLDLSTGINPVAYPVGNIPPDAWSRLPEPEAMVSLQTIAAATYGIHDPAMVVAAPGTQILISLLPHLLPQPDVAILGPTYGEHRASWQHCGLTPREVGTLDALHNATCAVLCNPNNPDGRRWSPRDLLALADTMADRGGLLIVDEAFVDFEAGLSLAPSLPHDAILILRSFGKTYGLAGLRLGFALAAPPLANRLRTALGPWAVAGPALTIGSRALADRRWAATAQARLAEDATRLDALLTAAGASIVGGTHLFRLVRLSDAPALFDTLGRAGIIVRRFAEHPDWLRFGLPGDQPGWDRLATALRTYRLAK